MHIDQQSEAEHCNIVSVVNHPWDFGSHNYISLEKVVKHILGNQEECMPQLFVDGLRL